MVHPVGYTFRCHRNYQVARTSTSVAVGDAGVIDSVSPDGLEVNITIHHRRSRPGAPHVAVPGVPIANLHTGQPFLPSDQPLPIVFTGPLIGAIRPLPPGNAQFVNDNSPFRRGLSNFLAGVWDHRDRIPHLNQHHRHLIGSDDNIIHTVKRFYENVRRVNPGFFGTFGRTNTTIHDLTPLLQPTNTNDHDAGIYLLILDQFKKRSNRAGMLPHAYVGKSNDIGRRIQHHNSTANGNEDGQEVHKVMREAERHRWFKLASHKVDEGHSAEVGDAMRDVMEATFMMLFGTMSHRVMVARIKNGDDLAKDLAVDYDHQEMAKVFTDLSRAAFGKVGYFLPGNPDRQVPFGLHVYGCNFTVPLGGEAFSPYEQVSWVRKDLGNKWAFHRSPLQFARDKRVSSMTYRSHEGGLSLLIQPTEDEIKAMGIQLGDEYRVIWEVMKPGEPAHDVPFMRLSSIGCWSNWEHANKVAFKIMWRSRKHNNQWRTKYMQRASRHRFVSNCSAPGALLDYSLGVGLYCYFARNRFPEAQSWTADFGSARILDFAVDTFMQRITVTPFVARADVHLTGPKYSADVARQQMQDLGLKNVNGAFKGFDWRWLSQPSMWKDGKVDSALQTRNYKRREKCDFCLLSSESSHSNIHNQTNICKQVTGSNLCEPCAKMGRPCSWTDLPSLFGVDTWKHEIRENRKNYVAGALHKATVKALICQPEAKGALQVYNIDSTSGTIITQEEQLQHEQTSSRRIDRSDLSSKDQEVYDLFYTKTESIILSMRPLAVNTAVYQARMSELAALVSAVATRGDISSAVRACLNYLIDRSIRPFMINGVVPIRGG